jgi:hypothetical protein
MSKYINPHYPIPLLLLSLLSLTILTHTHTPVDIITISLYYPNYIPTCLTSTKLTSISYTTCRIYTISAYRIREFATLPIDLSFFSLLSS